MKIENRNLDFKKKRISARGALEYDPAEEMDIFWLCLAKDCPKNCCGEQFNNGKVVNIYNMQHDQVPLLLSEKNQIIRRKGPHVVKMESDGMYYLNIPKNKGACPFLKQGQCDIQDIKPSLCRAYPLIQLDCHVGPIFDHDNCPGFEIGKKLGIRMKKCDYSLMLQHFITLQQYRLDRVRLELSQLTGCATES